MPLSRMNDFSKYLNIHITLLANPKMLKLAFALKFNESVLLNYIWNQQKFINLVHLFKRKKKQLRIIIKLIR